jgi:hypothetical protein
MSAPILPHVTPELARRAAKHFQCLYAEPQTEDDGHEMATNTLGAFEVLLDWTRRAAGTSGERPPLPPAPRRNQRRRALSQPSQE